MTKIVKMVVLILAVCGLTTTIWAGELEEFEQEFDKLVSEYQETIEAGKRSPVYRTYLKRLAALETMAGKIDRVVKKRKLSDLKKVSLKKAVTNYKNNFKKLDTGDSDLIIALKLSEDYNLVSFDERIGKFFVYEWIVADSIKTLQDFSYPELATPFTDNKGRVTYCLDKFLEVKKAVDEDLATKTGFDVLRVPGHDDFVKQHRKYKIGVKHTCGDYCSDTHSFQRSVKLNQVFIVTDGNQKMTNQKYVSDTEYTCDWTNFIPLKFTTKYTDSNEKEHVSKGLTPKSRCLSKDVRKFLKTKLDLVKKAAAKAKTEFKVSKYDTKPLLKGVGSALKLFKNYDLSSKDVNKTTDKINAECSKLNSVKEALSGS